MRVLRILTRANVGGPSRQALDLWDEDAAAGTRTLLAFGACGPGESEVDLGDRPELSLAAVDAGARGLLRLQRLGRATRPWHDALAAAELRDVIRRFRPDVVHTHTSRAGFFGRRAAWAEAVPVVAHTFHGHVLADYYPRPVSYVLRRVEARLARRTDLLFAVSPSCAGELATLGIGAGRIEVLPPALDLAGFGATTRADARRRLGLDASAFAVGFVGRMVPVKRPGLFAQLIGAMPEVEGVAFGDGPLASVVRGAPRIRYGGAVGDLAARLAGLDALVSCSRREGCPLAVLEAFAAGVPVVGFDVPGVRDAVRWGAGVLVPEAAGVPGLCAALRDLRAAPGGARELVAAARAGLERFAPRRIAREMAARYAAAAPAALSR